MDLTSLEIFCVVAEEGGITRAAQKLNRVQSNVTTRVQQLEEQLGVSLFQREGKRMVLTAEGERFIVYAKRLLSLAQEAMQSVNSAQPLGSLKIGSMEATAASRLPGPLAIFHSTWPDVVLEVSTGTSERLLHDVSQHRLDCALVALLPGQSLKSTYNKLSGLKIWNEQLMLLKPQGNSTGTPRNLAAFEQGCTYRVVGQEWFRKTVGKGVHVIEKNSYHGIMASVVAGTCAAVMPQSVLDLYQGTAMRCSVLPLQEVDTWLVWREQYTSAALDAFREICCKQS